MQIAPKTDSVQIDDKPWAKRPTLIESPKDRVRFQAVSIVVLVCVVYLLIPLHRVTPSVTAGPIISETGISAPMLGLLASSYFLTFGIMQMVSGMLLDYFGPRKTMTVFVLIAGLGTLLFAGATSWFGMIGGRALIGFGTSIIFLAGIKLFSLWFPPSSFARLNGLLLAMGGLGAILGSGLMGYLCESLGWRDASFIIGIITLVFTVLLFFFVKDGPGDKAVERTTEEKINPFTALKTVAKSKHFWLIAGWFCCQFSLCNAVGGLWGGQYLRDVHQLDTVSVGNVLNMFGIGTLVGSLANAWIIGYFSKESTKPMMPVASAVYIALFASLMMWGESFSIPILCVWFFLLAAFGMGSLFAGFACMPKLFGHKLVGTASGLLNTLPSIAVLILQPFTGMTLEMLGGIKTGYNAHEYSVAFSIYLIASVLSFVCAITVLRYKQSPQPQKSRFFPARQ